MAPRRIVAVVLPKLACEIAKSRAEVKGPLAILLDPTVSRPGGERGQAVLPGFEQPVQRSTFAKENAIIGAVCDEARRYGVRPGQKVAEATALVARLNVLTVTFAEIDRALGRVAEVAMSFGTTAAIQLAKRTGVHALGERVSALGHTVHLAIADGPRVAQALARWGVSDDGHLIAAEGKSTEALAPLPVRALPLPPDRVAFLLRVGVLTVGDLVRLPKAEAVSRLGARGAEALAVAAGFDPAPLVPFTLPPVLEEETSFDDSVHSVEPLLFVLRGATSRLSARLEARGEACTRVDIDLPYDASIARRNLADRGETVITDDALHERFHVDLPAPLSSAADLFRVLRTRLERTSLLAPVTGVRVTISEIARARRAQLDFARDAHADPNSLPALLAELSAEIGPERVGVLSIHDSIRLEARTRLAAVQDIDGHGKKKEKEEDDDGDIAALDPAALDPTPPVPDALCPARLLRTPISLGRAGSSVIAVTGQLYVVERRRFLARLDDVEWWTDAPCTRDYFRATLTSGTAPSASRFSMSSSTDANGNSKGVSAEALVYIDPRTEEAFLQGWFE